MLHILLSILKIIGIVLLVLIGFLLVLILLVLFVPVRYQAEARIYEDQKVFAKIHWLFRIIGVDIRYEEKQLLVRLKLLWFIPIQLVPKKPKKEKLVRKKKEQLVKKNPVSSKECTVPDKTADDPVIIDNTAVSDAGTMQTDHTETILEEAEVSRKSILDKIGNLFRKIIGLPVNMLRKVQTIFEKLKYTIRSICDKITDIKGQYDYYMEILKKEQTKSALSLCKNQLLKIFKHVMPRKLFGEFHVGLDDPASTGQLYGIYCATMMLHKSRVQFIPDFDQKILEGRVRLKGHIRGITFVMTALKIVFDKNIRYLINILKQKQGGNQNAVR